MEKKNRKSTLALWGILITAGLVLAGIELLSGVKHWSVIPTGKGAIDQAISPDETLLVVLNAGENSLSFIDLKTKIPFNKLYLPLEPLLPPAEGEKPSYVLSSVEFSGDGSELLVTCVDGRFFVVDPVLQEVKSTGKALEPGLTLLGKGKVGKGVFALDRAIGKLSLLGASGEVPVVLTRVPLVASAIDFRPKTTCGTCREFLVTLAYQVEGSGRLSLVEVDSSSLEVTQELSVILPSGATFGDIRRGDEGSIVSVTYLGGSFDFLWVNNDGTIEEQEGEPLSGPEGEKIFRLCKSGMYLAHLNKGLFTLLTYDKDAKPLRLDMAPGGFDGAELRSMSAYPEQADSFASAIGPHEMLLGVPGWEGVVVFDSSGQSILGFGNNDNNNCECLCNQVRSQWAGVTSCVSGSPPAVAPTITISYIPPHCPSVYHNITVHDNCAINGVSQLATYTNVPQDLNCDTPTMTVHVNILPTAPTGSWNIYVRCDGNLVSINIFKVLVPGACACSDIGVTSNDQINPFNPIVAKRGQLLTFPVAYVGGPWETVLSHVVTYDDDTGVDNTKNPPQPGYQDGYFTYLPSTLQQFPCCDPPAPKIVTVYVQLNCPISDPLVTPFYTINFYCDGNGPEDVIDSFPVTVIDDSIVVPGAGGGTAGGNNTLQDDPFHLSVGGQARRVDLHGVPFPEPSPTGGEEVDRRDDEISVDTYNLSPLYRVTDVAVPTDSEELKLEFRRIGGVRNFRRNSNQVQKIITYPTDFLVGLGWDTNASCRAIHTYNLNESAEAFRNRVVVMDSSGAVYTYYEPERGTFRPDLTSSLCNTSVQATLERQIVGTNPAVEHLVLTNVFGVRHWYSYVTESFLPGQIGSPMLTQTYYRLEYVIDRNGSQLNYVYLDEAGDLGYPPVVRPYLVKYICEEGHPERKLEFVYSDVDGSENMNGYDWGYRITEVRDPFWCMDSGTYGTRNVLFTYESRTFSDLGYSENLWLLREVKYPEVEVLSEFAEGSGEDLFVVARPAVTFDYHRAVLSALIIRHRGGDSLVPDPSDKMLWAGPSEITDAEGHTTQLSYVVTEYLSAVVPQVGGPNGYFFDIMEWEPRIRLDHVTPPGDGTAYFEMHYQEVNYPEGTGEGQPAEYAILAARTAVKDSVGAFMTYEFESIIRPLSSEEFPTKSGFGTFATELVRTSYEAKGEGQSGQGLLGAATFVWSEDWYANLVNVVDMCGNEVAFAYGNVDSKTYNLPTLRTAKSQATGGTISTAYTYGVFGKLSTMTDGTGKVTTYQLDPDNGNRERVVQPFGTDTREVEYIYDSEVTGRVIGVKQYDGPLGAPVVRWTEFVYEFDDQDPVAYLTVTEKVHLDGSTLDTVKVYDIGGNLRVEIDAKGFSTTYTYDARNKLRVTTYPPVVGPPTFAEEIASTVTLSYDLSGNIVRRVCETRTAGLQSPGALDNTATVFAYDEMDRLTTTRRRMTSWKYNDAAKDLITTSTYNDIGLIESTIVIGDSATFPQTTIFTYDKLLRKTSETRIWLSNLGVKPNVTKTYMYGASCDNAGSGTFDYTHGWQPVRVINERGFATDYVYDGFYRSVRVVSRLDGGAGIAVSDNARPGEPCTQYLYNTANDLVRKTVWNDAYDGSRTGLDDHISYTFYDELHRPTVTVLRLAVGMAYTPESVFVNDPVAFSADPGDIVTKTVYNKFNDVIQVVQVNGGEQHTTQYTYDLAGRRLTEVSPSVPNENGVPCTPTTVKTYDVNGNVETSTDPLGYRVKHVYDKRNRVSRTIADVNGDSVFDETRGGQDVVTEEYYDYAGNCVRKFDARQYDARAPEVQDPPNCTDVDYDMVGRAVTVTTGEVLDPENPGQYVRPQTVTVYDRCSQVLCVTDPAGIQKKRWYDSLGRVEREQSGTRSGGSPVAISSETVYDSCGNTERLRLLNKVGTQDYPQETRYDYDAYNRAFREENEVAHHRKETTYYRDGSVRTVVDPNGFTYSGSAYTANGRAKACIYDRAGRLSTETYTAIGGATSEVYTYTYDKVGNVTNVSNSGGSVVYTYAYDALHRQLTAARSGGGVAYTVTSKYDANGNRRTIIYPPLAAPETSLTVNRTYDRLNRVYQVTGSTVTTYGYDKNSNIATVTHGNGASTSGTYDNLNRCTSRHSQKGSTVLYNGSYVYDLSGNILNIVAEQIGGSERRQNITFAYDDQCRLTQESWSEGGSSRSYSYTYDLAGNRRQKVYAVGGTPVTTTNYTYDDAGGTNELLSESVVGGSTTSYGYDNNGNQTTKGSTTYTWDFCDRLVSTNTGFSATYDYLSRRLSKTESGTTTTFRHDGGLTIQEKAGAGYTSQFTLGNDLGYGIGGILLREKYRDTTEYFYYNHVGSTVAVSNAQGSFTQWTVYEAFGNVVYSYWVSSNRRLWNTRERDSSTELDFHGYRYYNPSTGRYVSRDPAGFADGLNCYLYTGNNPVTRVDPDGRLWGFLVTAVFAVVDTYQVATGQISGSEYAGRMALNGAALVADAATGGMGGGVAVRVAAAAARAGKVGKAVVGAAKIVDKVSDTAAFAANVAALPANIEDGNIIGVVQTAVSVKNRAKGALRSPAKGASHINKSPKDVSGSGKAEVGVASPHQGNSRAGTANDPGGSNVCSAAPHTANTMNTGDAVKGARKTDFVVGPDGTAVPVSQSRMRQGFDEAGFPSRPATQTAESGVIHEVPTQSGPIDVRTMEGSANHPRRAVTTRAGTNDPVKITGEKFPNGTPRADRRAGSHLEQTP